MWTSSQISGGLLFGKPELLDPHSNYPASSHGITCLVFNSGRILQDIFSLTLLIKFSQQVYGLWHFISQKRKLKGFHKSKSMQETMPDYTHRCVWLCPLTIAFFVSEFLSFFSDTYKKSYTLCVHQGLLSPPQSPKAPPLVLPEVLIAVCT